MAAQIAISRSSPQPGWGTNLNPPIAGTADIISKLNDRLSEVHAKIKQIGQLIPFVDSHLKSKMTDLVNDLGLVQAERLERDIRCWKYEQQRSVIGYPITMSFAKIHDLAEDLADVLLSVQNQLKVAEGIAKAVSRITKDDGTFSKLFTRTLTLLRELYQKTFLVEHLTLPIVRTNTKFCMNQKCHLTVSSLIAQKLNPRMRHPVVKVSIITKDTAEVLRTQGLAGICDTDLMRVGSLTENICRMELCNPDHPYFAAVFRHIKLLNLSEELEAKRRAASGGELVTDETFYLLCTSEFCIGDVETVEVWTMSCPIVVTTHWSQDCRAWGTLLWDYGLSSMDRTPLGQPLAESTTWPQILEMLNVFFCNAIGVRLTDEQANCLSSKAIRNGNPIQNFEDLCKKGTEGHRFSLWDWFYHATRLAEKHFKRELGEGHVMGFISRDRAEELLVQGNCKAGTFLIRFTDSVLGAITGAVLLKDGFTCVRPYDTKYLEKRCLGDQINSLIQFLTVYPNIPKVHVFGDPLNKPATQSKLPNYSKLIQLSFIAPLSTPNDRLNQLMEDILQNNWGELPNFDPDFVDNVLHDTNTCYMVG